MMACGWGSRLVVDGVQWLRWPAATTLGNSGRSIFNGYLLPFSDDFDGGMQHF